MNTPVLFLIFNRPQTTKAVFAAIRKAQPLKLYIAADGPRKDNASDISLCTETQEVVNQVDWSCEVVTLLREENLGCRNAVSSAVSWFFEKEEMGIILEDDCLPDPSFFTFCTVMLERYKNDNRITHIGGSNFQDGTRRGKGDYYYSNLVHVWGWAGWRRVWKLYDVTMKSWPEFHHSGYLKYLFPDKKIYVHLTNLFEQTFRGKINTWDFQLFFTCLVNRGLSVIPNVNLISNIGFAQDATHSVKQDANANRPTIPLDTFTAPGLFVPSLEADLYTLRNSFAGRISAVVDMMKRKSNYLFNQRIKL